MNFVAFLAQVFAFVSAYVTPANLAQTFAIINLAVSEYRAGQPWAQIALDLLAAMKPLVPTESHEELAAIKTEVEAVA